MHIQVTSDNGNPGVDVIPSSGSVVFTQGQANGIIPLTVVADDVSSIEKILWCQF